MDAENIAFGIGYLIGSLFMILFIFKIAQFLCRLVISLIKRGAKKPLSELCITCKEDKHANKIKNELHG